MDAGSSNDNGRLTEEGLRRPPRRDRARRDEPVRTGESLRAEARSPGMDASRRQTICADAVRPDAPRAAVAWLSTYGPRVLAVATPIAATSHALGRELERCRKAPGAASASMTDPHAAPRRELVRVSEQAGPRRVGDRVQLDQLDRVRRRAVQLQYRVDRRLPRAPPRGRNSVPLCLEREARFRAASSRKKDVSPGAPRPSARSTPDRQPDDRQTVLQLTVTIVSPPQRITRAERHAPRHQQAPGRAPRPEVPPGRR